MIHLLATAINGDATAALDVIVGFVIAGSLFIGRTKSNDTKP